MNKRKILLATLILCSFFIPKNNYAEDTYRNSNVEKVNSSTNSSLNEENKELKDPYKANENTARTSSPIAGNVTEKSNTKTPTKQTYTTGTITENVGEDGKAFPSEITPKRQFLTFTTNDGKEFHLIIDYLKNNQQVRMLTEVNESDLLNIIDKRIRNEDGTVESEAQMEERLRKEIKAEYEAKAKAQSNIEEETKEQPKKKEESSDIGIILFVGVVTIVIVFVKKFIKKKQKNSKPIDDNPEFSNELSENEYYEEDDDLEFEDENK